MNEFFDVITIEQALALKDRFAPVDTQSIALEDALGRVLAEDVVPDIDIPGFNRATVDGFALRAASTFGAGEANPAYLNVVGSVAMGAAPDIRVERGQAARIPTGGMLPAGADAVVMIEHTGELDETTIEVYRSVAPGQHVIAQGEDMGKGRVALAAGQAIRAQELGLLAAAGRARLQVFRQPVVGILSTGDEVIAVNETPRIGQIRDINAHSLAGLVTAAGGVPELYGIVADRFEDLRRACARALAASDMVLISGGSSVGARDFTMEVLAGLDDTEILMHGVAISPGKPTILARSAAKPFWGLPGHAASAMVVFAAVVQPFLYRLAGRPDGQAGIGRVDARLTRNLASAQGRVDFVRVRLEEKEDGLWAEPILGRSGLIHTMVQADGLVAIGLNDEGLDAGSPVKVQLF